LKHSDQPTQDCGRHSICQPLKKLPVRHDLRILDRLEPLVKEVEAELVRQSSLAPWAEQAAFLVQLPGISVHNAMLLVAAIGCVGFV
jgi:hypothetical protein